MTVERLALRHALSHPVRSGLTVLAVAIAVFLFSFLRSIVTSLEDAVTHAQSRRLMVTSAVSLFQPLPAPYRETLAGIPGVEDVCRFTWFGGYYQSPENFFAQFATDPASLLNIYPEVDIDEAQARAWSEDRRGCIVGTTLVKRYGWKVGDRVPIMGTIFARADGKEWPFDIRGIYAATSPLVDEASMYFHWDYLDTVLEQGEATGHRGSSIYIVRVAPDAHPDAVAQRIDSTYDRGPQRTRTQPEAVWQSNWVAMMGNIPLFLGMIGAAVLTALFLGVANTMTIAGRERIRSMGILRALGFDSRALLRLYVLESLLLSTAGGLLGLGTAWLTEELFRRAFLSLQVPFYSVDPRTFVLTGVLVGMLGLLGGLWPAIDAIRLRAVDALRRGG